MRKRKEIYHKIYDQESLFVGSILLMFVIEIVFDNILAERNPI